MKKVIKRVATVRKKLKPLLSLKVKYITTYKDIKKYFKILNNGLFQSKLMPFNEIEIKKLKYQKCMGQVIMFETKGKGTKLFKLEMDLSYDTKKDFLDTLAHEMVHLYQFTQINDTGAHNKHFYSFTTKLKYVGLTL